MVLISAANIMIQLTEFINKSGCLSPSRAKKHKMKILLGLWCHKNSHDPTIGLLLSLLDCMQNTLGCNRMHGLFVSLD
jgi:hypothetical protein